MADDIYLRPVRHVQAGESVSASVDSRPTRDLEAVTAYLADLVDAASLGRSTRLYDRPMAADVQVGDAVYYNATTAQFERALAAVVADGGSLVPSPSSYFVGICTLKKFATLGDIGNLGWITGDLSNSVDDQDAAGLYFLSAVTPGKMTLSRPRLAIPVLYNFGNGSYLLMPASLGHVMEHQHYKFDLVAAPAGDYTPPAVDDPHEITNPDEDMQGWLPADHESFEDLAPAGAVFGYNLRTHGELSSVFPPLPTSAAVVVWDRGDGYGGNVIGEDHVVVDANGIWWMTDCYQEVPWPVDYPGDVSAYSVCPAPPLKVSIYFHASLFAQSGGLVTSLTPKTGGGITLTGPDGEAATVGDLEISAELPIEAVTDAASAGHLVVKELDGNYLNFGPVTERLKAGSNVSLSSVTTKIESGTTYYYGTVEVNALTVAATTSISPQLIRLNDAKDRLYNGITYIGFPDYDEDKVSSVLMRFDVPVAGIPASPKLTVRVKLLGRTAGSLPDMSMSCIWLPSADTAEDLPDEETEVDFDPAGTVGANQYVEIDSDPIDIEAGGVLFVTLSRTSPDGYSGEIGVLSAVGVITA